MMRLGISRLHRLVRSLGEIGLVGFVRADPISAVTGEDPNDQESTTPDATTDGQRQPTWETTGERIERDLERAGGRQWQRDLSSSLDVSQATVSRWLSRLEEQGRVERVKVGREKLVVLPGHMPEIATTADASRRPVEA